jgi:probable HAF family extracellular repeat protein
MNTNIKKQKHFKLKDALAVTLLTFPVSQAQAINYTFSDMGTLAYANTTPMYSTGLNDQGQIAGGALWHDNWGFASATMYNGSSWVSLNGLAEPNDSLANDINNQGQITGYANVDSTFESYSPVRWEGTSATVLNRIPDDWFTSGQAINNNGQIAGIAETNSNGYHPIRWDGSVATELQTLGGNRTVPTDINDNAEIVGEAFTSNDEFKVAVYWDANGNITQLNKSVETDTFSTAGGINEIGKIVGATYDADFNSRAVIWDNSNANPIELTTIPGFTKLSASDINDSGQIVGVGTDANNVFHILLWDQGTVTDLNQFFSAALIAEGWKFTTNTPFINNQGMIVGHMFSSDSTQLASWSLTPTAVPVPDAVWLFGSALVGYIGSARRKKLAA